MPKLVLTNKQHRIPVAEMVVQQIQRHAEIARANEAQAQTLMRTCIAQDFRAPKAEYDLIQDDRGWCLLQRLPPASTSAPPKE